MNLKEILNFKKKRELLPPRCSYCGRFIAFKDIDEEVAAYKMISPDYEENCVNCGRKGYTDQYKMLLELLTDDRKTYTIMPFWCGYFEHLHSAEIVSSKSMRIEF